MYAGRIVEQAARGRRLRRPAASLHHRPHGLAALAGRRGGRLATIRGRGAAARPDAEGLPLRRPLPASATGTARTRCRRWPRSAPGHAPPAGRRRSSCSAAAGRMSAIRRPRSSRQHFERRDRLFDGADPPVRAVDGVTLGVHEGRDLRHRRRVRLRQVHAGPPAAAADRADRRRGRASRARTRSAACRTREMRALRARDADRLPGPVRLAQPAHDGRRHRRRAALAAQGRRPAGQRRERVAELLRTRRASARARRPLPARVLAAASGSASASPGRSPASPTS